MRSNHDRKARDRILTDDEISAVWTAAGDSGTFGALVKVLLLTAQRVSKAVEMKRDHAVDGVWTIATEPREKGNAGVLVLPPITVEVIEAPPEIVGNLTCSPPRSETVRSNSFSQRKEEPQEKLPAKMPAWTLNDLRRTARSLMARAGIADNIAERVLGHAIAGVEGVYNRHAHRDEKAEALTRLATLRIRSSTRPTGPTGGVSRPALTPVLLGLAL